MDPYKELWFPLLALAVLLLLFSVLHNRLKRSRPARQLRSDNLSGLQLDALEQRYAGEPIFPDPHNADTLPSS